MESIYNPLFPYPLQLMEGAVEQGIPVTLTPDQAKMILEHHRLMLEEKNEVIRLNYQLQQRQT